WKRGTKAGAMAGLAVGFVIWAITLPLPTLAEAGVLPMQIVENGWFNLDFLKPYNLFGMEGMDKISHGAFWSLLFNFVAFVGVSLNTRLDANELTQADLFVDIFKHQSNPGEYEVMRREAKMRDIQILLNRFLGAERAEVVLSKYETDNNVNLSKLTVANADLVNYAETNLAGALGAASAKVILDSVVKEDPISLEEMFKILEQTQEIFQYSRALEEKSKELEETTQQLQLANEQLQEVDKLKENFITTITHELRTPLTSIKSLAKILEDYPTLSDSKRAEFLGIIVGESERVTRLINEVLELSKLQSAAEKWHPEPLDPAEVIESASHALHQLMKEKKIALTIQLPENKLLVHGVKDRLMQVVVNLISNAVKFCPPKGGKIEVQLYQTGNHALLSVRDNGIGIESKNHELIFEKFAQVSDPRLGKPQGSGLGLAICR
ncbi:MAG: ATP-binding protein, partial [Bacteroidota bacterium]